MPVTTHEIGYIITSTQNSCTARQTVETQINRRTQDPQQVMTAGVSECPKPRIAPALIS